MADQTVGVLNPSGAGTLKVDTSELTVGANTVERQRIVIADPVGAGLFANVTAAGALKVDASATTQPVTGTFYQATQPVSIASMPSTPVTGTFWQATQPVSGTVTATISGSISNTGFNATQSGTWNVGLSAGAAVIGSLAANQSVNVAQMNGVATSMGVGASDAGTQRVTLSSEATQDLNITGQTAQSTLNNNIVLATAGSGSTDATGYRGLALQIITTAGITGGVVTFEGSNDNSNFVAVALSDEAAPTSDPVTSVTLAASASRFMIGPLHWRYFRARISTAVAGGTVSAVTRLMQVAYSEDQITVTQSTASQLNVNIGSTTGGVNLGLRPAATNSGVSVGRFATGASGVFKASAGNVYGWALQNTNAAARYLQLYAKASAGIPGTDTPLYAIPLPASGLVSLIFDVGIAHITGIAWAITTDFAGTTAGASGDMVGTVFYA